MSKAVRTGVLALLLAALLAGCGREEGAVSAPPPEHGPEEVQQARFRFGVGYSGTGYTESFAQWRDLVLEDTGGAVELLLYGGNVLGEGRDMIKAAQRGTLSIVASSTSVCTAVVPETAVLDIPACFEAYSRPFQVYDGVFFQALNEYYRQQGLELLYLRTGEPWLISSPVPVTSLEQLRGLRVRTSGSSYHNKLYDALGIQRVEDVGLSGLAYLLEENGVDGLETTYTILDSQGLLEVQPYGLKGFFVMSSAVVMNYDAFHALPTDYQASLKTQLRDLLNQRQEEVRSQEEEGMTVHELDQEDQRRLRELAQPLRDSILSSIDEQLVQALIAENKQAEETLF